MRNQDCGGRAHGAPFRRAQGQVRAGLLARRGRVDARGCHGTPELHAHADHGRHGGF